MAVVLFILGIGRALFNGATRLLAGLDRCLIGLAKPLGAHADDPVARYACFFGSYGVLFALACLPVRWLPLLALAVGYLGILAVGRAWSANEARRTQIARKLWPATPMRCRTSACWHCCRPACSQSCFP